MLKREEEREGEGEKLGQREIIEVITRQFFVGFLAYSWKNEINLEIERKITFFHWLHFPRKRFI